MLLILEILLTIFAWRKGWKWFALLPLGIGVVISFLIGIIVGASGGSVDTAKGIGLVFDILVIIILVVMNIKKPDETKSDVTKEF